jgi:hypothetical protein
MTRTFKAVVAKVVAVGFAKAGLYGLANDCWL